MNKLIGVDPVELAHWRQPPASEISPIRGGASPGLVGRRKEANHVDQVESIRRHAQVGKAQKANKRRIAIGGKKGKSKVEAKQTPDQQRLHN